MLRRGSLVVDICPGGEGRDDGDRNAVRFLPRPEEGTPAPVLGRAKKRSRVVLGSA